MRTEDADAGGGEISRGTAPPWRQMPLHDAPAEERGGRTALRHSECPELQTDGAVTPCLQARPRCAVRLGRIALPDRGPERAARSRAPHAHIALRFVHRSRPPTYRWR